MSITYLALFILGISIFSGCRPDQKQPPELLTPKAVYTKADPAEWSGKEDEHTPSIEILSQRGPQNILVRVTLKNPQPSHYIEKIFIADHEGKPYQERLFLQNSFPQKEPKQSPEDIEFGRVITAGRDRQYVATFTLPITEEAKKRYALYARCSQHDVWKSEF